MRSFISENQENKLEHIVPEAKDSELFQVGKINIFLSESMQEDCPWLLESLEKAARQLQTN